MARSEQRLLQGTLDMMILKILSCQGAAHGYEVARQIKQRSEEWLIVEEGSLYPALHRLEKRALVASEWRQSDSNRRAKYYALTASGKKSLATEQTLWSRTAEAINRVLASDSLSLEKG
jgi:PadR family transcriptional regulator PadR